MANMRLLHSTQGPFQGSITTLAMEVSCCRDIVNLTDLFDIRLSCSFISRPESDGQSYASIIEAQRPCTTNVTHCLPTPWMMDEAIVVASSILPAVLRNMEEKSALAGCRLAEDIRFGQALEEGKTRRANPDGQGDD